MDEEKNLFSESEIEVEEIETASKNEEISLVTEEETDPSAEDDTPVTEADVVAAFNEASKSLGLEPQAEEETIEETPDEEAEPENTIDTIAVERNNFVMQFQMDFSVDDIPDAEGMGISEEEIVAEESPVEEDKQPEEQPVVDAPETIEEERPEPSKSRGCLWRIVFALLIVLLSVALATVITTAVFDITGFNRNNESADVIIPEGANTEKVAAILKKEGMIKSEFWFCTYCRVMNLDDKWQAGSFSLQADMGFPTLINTMQALPPRKTVRVTFPEGLTVPEMAAILEEKKVCSAESFINAVNYGDYDYSFVREIPTEADSPEYASRAYRLEGYLFPDTYEFYVGSLGETVVDRMLQNFESKISKSVLAQITNSGWTLDQAITFASIIQGEADTMENMEKVSRVLYNRLDSNSGFKKLQLCSTRDYVTHLLEVDPDTYDAEVLKEAYNTYFREGFPVGAINNPGLAAITAVLNPSTDSEAMKYYYFATDYEPDDGSDTPITYFSKTYDEHKAICKKYGIEDIG